MSRLPIRCFASVFAAALALGAAACVDAGRCDAALASAERAHAEAARQEAQLVWLRMQLATFATDLQARQAADRDLLLRRLDALEAANAALLRRLGTPPGPAAPAPQPSPPPAAAETSADPSRRPPLRIDETNPYR